MGLFNNKEDKQANDFKNHGYSVQCYGETENTKHMSQFLLYYVINVSLKTATEKHPVGAYYEIINDDLYKKNLVPASIKVLEETGTYKYIQVIAKRNDR